MTRSVSYSGRDHTTRPSSRTTSLSAIRSMVSKVPTEQDVVSASCAPHSLRSTTVPCAAALMMFTGKGPGRRRSARRCCSWRGFSVTAGLRFGGGRGIRTPGALSGTTVFKTAAIDRSAIPPACDAAADRRGSIFQCNRITIAVYLRRQPLGRSNDSTTTTPFLLTVADAPTPTPYCAKAFHTRQSSLRPAFGLLAIDCRMPSRICS